MRKSFLLFLLLWTVFFYGQHTSIPDPNFEKALIDLGIDSGPLDKKVLTANISGLTSLDISGKGITDMKGIEGFISLQILNCDNNNFTSIDLSKNIALIKLSIEGYYLDNLDVSSKI